MLLAASHTARHGKGQELRESAGICADGFCEDTLYAATMQLSFSFCTAQVNAWCTLCYGLCTSPCFYLRCAVANEERMARLCLSCVEMFP